ncbi:MAG TPA: MFS transporter [Acidobacteriaceae bacterium]|jgi:MFS family permease|nr:MFS transporter [Acidobacteriaceae bacterium]
MPSAAIRSDAVQTRVFRGWWIVLVAVVGQCFGLSTVLVYTFGVFAKPLGGAFHATRGSIAMGVSLLDVAVTFSAPAVGRIVDRFGARRVIVLSQLALVACLVGLSVARPPLWHLYVLYALAGATGVATVSVTYARVLANWFDRKRGLALGLASTGIGLGAFIGPSLAQVFIDRFGWRLAFVGLAATTLLIALPVVALFLVERPEQLGLRIDGAEGHEPIDAGRTVASGMTVREAIRTPTFWLLCGIFFVVGACGNGTAAHVVPLLTDAGESTRSAAFAASMFGFASIFGRVGNGYLVDRFFAPRVIACMFGAATVGIAMLWLGCAGTAAYVAMFLVGLAIGAESDVMPFLISRYFGMRSMGELFGCAFGSYTLGNATGRYLVAAGFDATGSYRIPLAYATAALMVATAATFLLQRYRQFTTA